MNRSFIPRIGIAPALILTLTTFNISLPWQEASIATPIPSVSGAKDIKICAQIISYATDPNSGECKMFATPCDVPEGWKYGFSCDKIDRMKQPIESGFTSNKSKLEPNPSPIQNLNPQPIISTPQPPVAGTPTPGSQNPVGSSVTFTPTSPSGSFVSSPGVPSPATPKSNVPSSQKPAQESAAQQNQRSTTNTTNVQHEIQAVEGRRASPDSEIVSAIKDSISEKRQRVAPDTHSENLKQKKVGVVESGAKTLYEVSVTSSKKLLWFIPVEVEKIITVSEQGEVISEKKSFLQTILNLLSF